MANGHGGWAMVMVEPSTIAISHEPLAMSSYLLSNADNLHHFGDRVHAYDVGAGEDGGGDGGRCAPVAFARGALANCVAHEGLARRSDQQRPVERGRQLRQARQHTITVGRPFGKPDAWVEDDLLQRDAA